MLKRRDFLKAFGATAATVISRHALAATIPGDEDAAFHFASDSIEFRLSPVAPEFLSLNVDGLGQGRRAASVIGTTGRLGGYTASSSISEGVRRVEYRAAAGSEDSRSLWTFAFSGSRIVLTSDWSPDFEPAPLVFHFDLAQVHSTVLGLFRRRQPAGDSGAVEFSLPGFDAPHHECFQSGINL